MSGRDRDPQGSSRVGVAAWIVTIVTLACGSLLAQPSSSEIRALWIQRGSLATPAGILAAVDMAKAGKFNTLIVQVRGRGDAFYDSRYEPRPPRSG